MDATRVIPAVTNANDTAITTSVRLDDILRLTADRISSLQNQPILEFYKTDDPVLSFLSSLLTTLEMSDYKFKDQMPEKAIQFLKNKSKSSGWTEKPKVTNCLTSKERMNELRKLAQEQLQCPVKKKILGNSTSGWTEQPKITNCLTTKKRMEELKKQAEDFERTNKIPKIFVSFLSLDNLPFVPVALTVTVENKEITKCLYALLDTGAQWPTISKEQLPESIQSLHFVQAIIRFGGYVEPLYVCLKVVSRSDLPNQANILILGQTGLLDSISLHYEGPFKSLNLLSYTEERILLTPTVESFVEFEIPTDY